PPGSIFRLVAQPCKSLELIVNVTSFFFLSLMAFRQNADYLFFGLDGRFEVSLISNSSVFVPPSLGYTNNFLQGLRHVWFSVNPALLLSYFLSLSEQGLFTNFPLAYAACATELFIATYVVGRTVNTGHMTALVAAWVLPLLAFQYVGWNLIPNTFRAFPH